jgi:hypothetical protein
MLLFQMKRVQNNLHPAGLFSTACFIEQTFFRVFSKTGSFYPVEKPHPPRPGIRSWLATSP